MDELMVVCWLGWGLPEKLRFGVPAGGSESGPAAIFLPRCGKDHFFIVELDRADS